MGESIDKDSFNKSDLAEFMKRLRSETLILKKMLEGREFNYSAAPKVGLEVEAWLLDKRATPSPSNQEFLESCNDKNIVEELAQFNFELNTDPVNLKNDCFSQFKHQLETTWSKSKDSAKKLGVAPCLVGIHPMITDKFLKPEFMSADGRYKALCDRIIELRGGKPISIDIEGRERYVEKIGHIMMESAATSIQVHIQANQENFKRLYNASLIASTPTVAVAANSPFFNGYDLWDETRIPLFEQAVKVASFKDKRGNDIGRVTFGTGYVKRSLIELFLENLDGYPPLIPILFDDPPEKLHHLNFHNGTLWRWNRPIIGFDSGTPNLRVEQRVMASGPTITDIVANTAFSIGLTLYLADLKKTPEESITFTDCKSNFYGASKYGLNAKVRWFGRTKIIKALVLDELIPQAKEGLRNAGIDSSEIEYYLDGVISPRVESGQNGSEWQRSFVGSHGRDLCAMSMAYQEQQETGEPVHKWKI